MSNTVRVASLSHFVTVAEGLGLKSRAMLREVGIDPNLLSDAEARISAQAVARVLEDAAAAAQCPAFGLLMAELRQISDLGPIALIISHQRTLRDMLETIIRYRRLMNASLNVQVQSFDDVVVIRQALEIDDAGSLRQAHELANGVMHRLFSAQTNGRWLPLTVNFTHPSPPDLAVHRRVFRGARLEFGSAFNGFTCHRADFEAPIPTADPRLAEWAEAFVRTLPNAEPGPIAQEVSAAVELLLPEGDASISRVAARLGLNARTLQRRLSAEGDDYATVLNSARRRVAIQHLANGRMSLIDVAGLVGYVRQSSFSRWFSSEFGMSATEWRQLGHA